MSTKDTHYHDLQSYIKNMYQNCIKCHVPSIRGITTLIAMPMTTNANCPALLTA